MPESIDKTGLPMILFIHKKEHMFDYEQCVLLAHCSANHMEVTYMRSWLVKARGEKSQREIAAAVGIRQGYYSMLENGLRVPSVRVAMKLDQELGVDWRKFFEENEEEIENGRDI